jgi:hypothetical protein
MIDRANDTTSEERVFEIDGLFQLENAALAHRLKAIARFDRDGLWREDGCSSAAHWLSYRYSYAWHTATRFVKVAHALEERPKIWAALAEGRLIYENVAQLCSFVPPEDDEEWAERAQHHNAAQIKSFARHARRMMRREAERTTNERYLSMRWHEDAGHLRLHANIPGAEGAAVQQTLERLAEKAGRKDDDTWDPFEQRAADALVEMCRTTLASDTDSDRATVVVHCDVQELGRIHGTATLEDGPLVASETLRRLACDARLQMVVHGPNGEPIGVGRTSRIVPPWMYRLLKARDVCCVYCGRRRGTQAHHVIHWAHGGRTDLDNLILLCWRCHRMIHDQGFRLARDQHGNVRMIRPNGVPVRRHPYPMRPETKERMLGPSHPRTSVMALRR